MRLPWINGKDLSKSNATKAANVPAMCRSVSAASFMEFSGNLMEVREGLLGSEYPCLRHLRQTVSGRLIATKSHQPGHQQPFDQQCFCCLCITIFITPLLESVAIETYPASWHYVVGEAAISLRLRSYLQCKFLRHLQA